MSKLFYDEKFGKGMTQFFGEELLEGCLVNDPKGNPAIVQFVQRLKELNKEAKKISFEEHPELVEKYWNLFKGGTLVLARVQGFVLVPGEEYTVEKLAYFLIEYLTEKNGEPDFIKEFYGNVSWLYELRSA